MPPRTDPGLRALIPPLTADECATLEHNLERDGCRDPLVVWDGEDVILDTHILGHLRENPLSVVRVRGRRGDAANAKPMLVPFPWLEPRRDAPAEFKGTPFDGTPARRMPRWFRQDEGPATPIKG